MRLNEYLVLLYRIFLIYVVYFISRLAFVLYNNSILKIDFLTFLQIQYHGIAFDNTAILYTNGLFILLSILPFLINTKGFYQKVLFYIYFIINIISVVFNFIDVVYYQFSFTRTTTSSLSILENEQEKMGGLFSSFLVSYWGWFVGFGAMVWVWIFLYIKVKVKVRKVEKKIPYFLVSILGFILITGVSIIGIRGDYREKSRPINMVDASRKVNNLKHVDAVLNTPFAIIRTIDKNEFKPYDYVSSGYIDTLFQPIKQYNQDTIIKQKPNVVLFILESFGREYIGAFNKGTAIENYKSYTPFLDSLAQNSLVFTHAYANGRQSIHGMPSILSGIPSFKVAFMSSPYSVQPTNSLPSSLEEMGYNTSFFHGAYNGSMGFLGYSKILGIDKYYGIDEYNNNEDYDGLWGIWDEPFLQFMGKELNTFQEPFFSTVFTLSSHAPFKVPPKYQGKFDKGNLKIHQCVGYSDHALREFFKFAKKQNWYQNTLFVFTADHTNEAHYKEYANTVNKFAVPIMFFKPDNSLTGVNTNLAQQLDLYPTIMDLVGYKKAFRSWGRSLVSDTSATPFVINHTGTLFQFMKGEYICIFNGEEMVGLYHESDLDFKNNLIHSENAELKLDMENGIKAYIQDYMDRLINRKLKE